MQANAGMATVMVGTSLLRSRGGALFVPPFGVWLLWWALLTMVAGAREVGVKASAITLTD